MNCSSVLCYMKYDTSVKDTKRTEEINRWEKLVEPQYLIKHRMGN